MSKEVEEVTCNVHRERSGEYWCSDCDEILCSECQTCHCKSFGSHTIFRYDDFILGKEWILSIENCCNEHNKKLLFFCTKHDTPCCVLCLGGDHSRCDTIKLETYLNNFKISFTLYEIETTAKRLSDYIEASILQKVENFTRQKERKAQITDDIRLLRKSVNEHLDALEKTLLEDLSCEFEKLAEEIELLPNVLADKREQIKAIESKARLISKCATETQAFFGIRQLENELNQHERHLVAIQGKGSNLELKVDPTFLNFKETFSHLGKIIIQKISNDWIMHRNTIRGIHQVNLKRQTYIKLKSDVNRNRIITGCTILANGQTVFVDFQNSTLLVHNENGSHDRNIELPGQPSDISLVLNKTVAVTLWSENTVLIFDLETDMEVQRIEVRGKCYGVDFFDNQLLVSFEKLNFVQILRMDGKLEQSIKLPTNGFAYIVEKDGLFFCSEEKENRLKCFTKKGEVLWSFKNEVLLNPHHLTTDNEGFVYVCSHKTNKVLVISKDGTHSRTLLSGEDGLNRPSAINISRDSNKLLVCNAFSGDAHLYSFIRK